MRDTNTKKKSNVTYKNVICSGSIRHFITDAEQHNLDLFLCFTRADIHFSSSVNQKREIFPQLYVSSSCGNVVRQTDNKKCTASPISQAGFSQEAPATVDAAALELL